MVVTNPNLRKSVNKVEKKTSKSGHNTGLARYTSQLNPEKNSTKIPNSLQDFRSSLSQKLKEQSENFRLMRSQSQLQEMKAK